MSENGAEWIRRHAKAVSVGLVVVVMTVGAVFFPHSIPETVAVVVVLMGLMVSWARAPLPRPKTSVAGIPELTIRDHLKRSTALYVRIMVPLLTAWVVVMTFFFTDIPKPQQEAWTIGGAMALSLIGSLFLRSRLRCPRCGTDFHKERIARLGRWSFDTRTTTDLWDACPRCGVSFDEPYR